MTRVVFKIWEVVSDPTLVRAVGFYNTYHQLWALIEQGRTLLHYENTTFVYHTVEETTSKDVFHYLFDVGVKKFLLEKRKRYFHKLFERWDLEHLQLDEDFDNYLDNDGLEDITRDEGM